MKGYASKFNDIDTNYSHEMRETFLRYKANYKICTGKEATLEMFEILLSCDYANQYYNLNYDSNKIGNINGCVDIYNPKIYVTIHLGAYRIIGGFLFERGVNVCIPVTAKVYTEQFDRFMLESQNARENKGMKVEFINIEEISGIIKLIRAVKNKYSIVFYLDGNSGIGGMDRLDEKLINFMFFNREIKIRKGIDLLSSLLNIPIVPIITYLSKNEADEFTPNIDILEEIHFFNKSLKNNCSLCIDVWNILLSYINRYPEQWEGWCYIDAFYLETTNIRCTPLNNEHSLKFNHDRYDFIIKDNYYLYDLHNNNMIKMSRSLYFYIFYLFKNDITISRVNLTEKLIHESLVDDLLKHQILI